MRLGWFGRGQPPPKFASQRATVPLSDHVTPPINPVRNDHASMQTAGALYVGTTAAACALSCCAGAAGAHHLTLNTKIDRTTHAQAIESRRERRKRGKKGPSDTCMAQRLERERERNLRAGKEH